ncbi:MAG TPA: UDP-N-acetylmuramate--L-alanine ligase, partial [Variovorax sp.]|nr:UDP-N-acetylmuramate--L-alanine ligase [Variovorax sp.]
LRVAGKVEPVFVDDIGVMPQAILDNARAGDVVLCMGAGSIGAVPGKVVEIAAAASLPPTTRTRRKGEAS